MSYKPVGLLYRIAGALEAASPTVAKSAYDDAVALRRIAMTLHRWHELECGDSNGCIERGRKEGGEFISDENGKPFMANYALGKARHYPIPDRKRGALKRLAAIMARYPTLRYYVQTDPRGAPLYLIRPGDVPEGADLDSCYSRGLAIHK